MVYLTDQSLGKEKHLWKTRPHIKNIPTCEGDESTLFLINTVEKAYRDLTRMKLEHEINNSTIVAIIEEKLSSEITNEWIKLVAKSQSPHVNKFPHLFELLKEFRVRIEYKMSDIRAGVVETDINYTGGRSLQATKHICWIHKDNGTHPIWQCNEFLAKTQKERVELVMTNNGCFACLRTDHQVNDCKRGFKCRIDQCQKKHNDLLHEAHVSGMVFHSRVETTNSILQLQIILGSKGGNKRCLMNALWDSASNLSFITSAKAAELGLVGKPVVIQITTVGGEKRVQQTTQYKLTLIDKKHVMVKIDVIALKKISSSITKVELKPFIKLFNAIKDGEVSRPEHGEVDVLVGYNYAAYHPVRVQANGHLLFLRNRFGGIIAGSHKSINERTSKLIKDATVCSTSCEVNNLDDVFIRDNLGIACTPKCGGCKCGKCHPGGKDISLQEEYEYDLIKSNLHYDPSQS